MTENQPTGSACRQWPHLPPRCWAAGWGTPGTCAAAAATRRRPLPRARSSLTPTPTAPLALLSIPACRCTADADACMQGAALMASAGARPEVEGHLRLREARPVRRVPVHGRRAAAVRAGDRARPDRHHVRPPPARPVTTSVGASTAAVLSAMRHARGVLFSSRPPCR